MRWEESGKYTVFSEYNSEKFSSANDDQKNKKGIWGIVSGKLEMEQFASASLT
jgi:hypothetical protein